MDIEAARRFYSGPWLDGIRSRYGNDPEIEYFSTLAILDNAGGIVTLPDHSVPAATLASLVPSD